jgi:RNA polymerase sigma factor (TIGR02999 family)
MRRILVEQARRKHRLKRGGDFVRHELDDVEISTHIQLDEILAIDEALRKLEAQNQPAAELVKLRYFAGMTIPESAEALGISPRKADQVWAYAKAWLLAEMEESGPA